MSETSKDRFIKQLKALKERDFKEVIRISREIKDELLSQKEDELSRAKQKGFAGFK